MLSSQRKQETRNEKWNDLPVSRLADLAHQRCSLSALSVLLLLKYLRMTGMVHKSLSLTLGQSFEHITLYSYNGAAILGGGGGGGHPYIWSTTVLHNKPACSTFDPPTHWGTK